MKRTAQRYHDISCGHRVHGHEGKCKHLHGHNYRIHFVCKAGNLDTVGRVIDFSVIKEKLCMWVEMQWDHKFLAWEHDPLMCVIQGALDEHASSHDIIAFGGSVVWVPFNPTAENMAEYLVKVVGPQQLSGTGVVLTSCTIEETSKCSATFSL